MTPQPPGGETGYARCTPLYSHAPPAMPRPPGRRQRYWCTCRESARRGWMSCDTPARWTPSSLGAFRRKYKSSQVKSSLTAGPALFMYTYRLIRLRLSIGLIQRCPELKRRKFRSISGSRPNSTRGIDCAIFPRVNRPSSRVTDGISAARPIHAWKAADS